MTSVGFLCVFGGVFSIRRNTSSRDFAIIVPTLGFEQNRLIPALVKLESWFSHDSCCVVDYRGTTPLPLYGAAIS